jgi:hypothetical protein
VPVQVAFRERIRDIVHADVLELAAKMEVAISDERARQQAGFAEDLEAIANAEHQRAARGFRFHRLHDGRELGDRAAAEIIAKRKPARQHDEIVAADGLILVPDVIGCEAALLQRDGAILIAVRSGEANDGGFHDAGVLLRLNGELVVLDDGVRKQVAAELVQLRLGLCAIQLEFDHFPDAYRRYRRQAVVVNGVAHSHALGVEHALLWEHDDLSFHRAGDTSGRSGKGATGKRNSAPGERGFPALRAAVEPLFPAPLRPQIAGDNAGASVLSSRMFSRPQLVGGGLVLLCLTAFAGAEPPRSRQRR